MDVIKLYKREPQFSSQSWGKGGRPPRHATVCWLCLALYDYADIQIIFFDNAGFSL